jgi:outer membrane receptor protein involved in Fe transport
LSRFAIILLGASALSTAAFAQGANDSQALEEVVVTATRQSESLNRIPLSVSAQTQKSMDQIGIRTIGDLQGRVPALQIQQQGPGVSNIIIRGISNTGSSPTAATTGFYLNDIPMQKRNTYGFTNAPSNGTPLPPLFDMERVEVLRGPQGTLFGGGSEGGTIRYITPGPSLTRYSAYARGEVSHIDKGGETYEGGVAVGGPIIQDKLGFRASYFNRNSAGWIDFIDPFTSQVRHKNANSGDTRVFNASLMWAPTENTRVTFSYLQSLDATKTNSSATTRPVNNAIVEAPACYAGRTGAIYGPNPAPIACSLNGAPNPNVAYQRPGATYGPYPNLGTDDFLAVSDLSPSKTLLWVPSLTLEYNAEKFSVKSVTAYVHDESRGEAFGALELGGRTGLYTQGGVPTSTTCTTPGSTGTGTPVACPANSWNRGLGISTQFRDAGIPSSPYSAYAYGRNQRHQLTQELRFSSAGDARPFSWVAGVFYSNSRISTDQTTLHGQDDIQSRFYGLSTVQTYRQPLLPARLMGYGDMLGRGNLNIGWDDIQNYLKDVEIAAFGEGNYWVTDKLRLTAGVRFSRIQFDYRQVIFGPANGLGDEVTGAVVGGRTPLPTVQNRGIVNGATSEDPITPKFGAQYQITDNDMVYVTASKGFRAGGVNANPSPGVCEANLQLQNLSLDSVPRTFASDTVWNYEAGAKLRMLNNRLQVNGSVYRIDWNNVQFQTSVSGCSWITNAASARVQGGELEVQANLIRGLNANLAVGYTNAKYQTDTRAPNPAQTLLAAKDQKFALAPWTVNVGLRYDHALGANLRGYIRGDWRWAEAFDQNFFGLPGYSPDTARVPSIDRTNVRAGVEFGDVDLNVFVNNLFNQRSGSVAGGRGACTTSPADNGACLAYSSYNPFVTQNMGMPRAIGVQIAYRH